MPAPPVSLRTFPRDDEVLVVSEIYDRQSTPPHTVDIQTTVRSVDGAVRFQSMEERSSAELQDSAAYRYAARVPMNKLEPGRYALTIEARSRLGQTASRQIPFEVVP
jgi:hypothetical protein